MKDINFLDQRSERVPHKVSGRNGHLNAKVVSINHWIIFFFFFLSAGLTLTWFFLKESGAQNLNLRPADSLWAPEGSLGTRYVTLAALDTV